MIKAAADILNALASVPAWLWMYVPLDKINKNIDFTCYQDA